MGKKRTVPSQVSKKRTTTQGCSVPKAPSITKIVLNTPVVWLLLKGGTSYANQSFWELARDPHPIHRNRILAMTAEIVRYLRDRWPFSHSVHVYNIKSLVHLCDAEPWHIYAITQRIWRRHVCVACNWVTDCTEPNEYVFEPGCGSGANLLWLAQKRGFSNLHGCDISPEALRLCQMLSKQAGISIAVHTDDCLQPKSLPSNVATILSVNWLYHIPGASMPNFLATYRPCLKPRGKIVCDVIDAAYNQYPNNQYHTDDLSLPPSKRRTTRYLFRYSRKEMETICADNGFRVLRHTRLHASVPRVVYMLEVV